MFSSKTAPTIVDNSKALRQFLIFFTKIFFMNYEYTQSDLSRGVLSGLFAGIASAVLNLAFMIIYRYATHFSDFNGIDITVIVFGSLLLSIACGIVFYFFVHFLNKGIAFYRILVLIITLVIIILGIVVRTSVAGRVPFEFRVLVVGTQTVIGLLAIFLIPYVFAHDKMIS